jgi:hypothetical protein
MVAVKKHKSNCSTNKKEVIKIVGSQKEVSQLVAISKEASQIVEVSQEVIAIYLILYFVKSLHFDFF